jgi:hypothetical protein
MFRNKLIELQQEIAQVREELEQLKEDVLQAGIENLTVEQLRVLGIEVSLENGVGG